MTRLSDLAAEAPSPLRLSNIQQQPTGELRLSQIQPTPIRRAPGDATVPTQTEAPIGAPATPAPAEKPFKGGDPWATGEDIMGMSDQRFAAWAKQFPDAAEQVSRHRTPVDYRPPPPTMTIDATPAPKSAGEAVTQQFSDIAKFTTEAFRKGMYDAGEALNDMFHSKTVFGAGLAALNYATAGLEEATAPVYGLARGLAFDPAERLAKTYTGKGEGIGYAGGQAAYQTVQIFAAPPATKAGGRVATAIGESKIGEGTKAMLSPTSAEAGKTVTLRETIKSPGQPRVTRFTTMPEAKASEYIVRANAGMQARAREQTAAALEQFRDHFEQMAPGTPQVDQYGGLSADPNTRLGFINAIETGNLAGLSPEAAKAAGVIRKMLDDWKTRVQSLGKNYLKDAIANYFPHIWKNPTPQKMAIELDETVARATSKSSLKGRAAFLKKRTIGDTLSGIARGLEPVTTNPLDLSMIKLWEMQKFYYGTKILQEMKRTGMVRFSRTPKDVPEGFVPLEGPEFRIFAPAMIAEHFNAYDPSLRGGLKVITDYLGIRMKTPFAKEDKVLRGGAYGYTQRGGSEVVARFGSDEAVMFHEIGHQLDFKYGLANYFERDSRAWDELGNLAMLRAGGRSVGSAYTAYLLEPTERIANLLHAYWHARETLTRIAPRAALMFDDFLRTHPDIGDKIKSVRPSVAIEGETKLEKGIGPQYMGKYYASSPAHRILSNYLSPGFRGQPVYDAIRQMGNTLNQAQLAWPGFHAIFVTNDTMVSELSRGIERAFHGEKIGALKSLLTTPVSVVSAIRKGAQVRQAYMMPEGAPAQAKALADALASGGGRVKMDEFYRAHTASGRFVRAIQDGRFWQLVWGDLSGSAKGFAANPKALPHMVDLAFRNMMGSVGKAVKEKGAAGAAWAGAKGAVKGGLHGVARTADFAAAPIMDWMVPRAKLGVFSNLAEDWMRRNPTATEFEKRAAMGEIWDSVDNRLGQMAYDNLFWTKAAKDVAFMAVRSVGWNLGTVRELGGGAVDSAKAAHALMTGTEPKLTHRMAYAFALPFVAGIEGAILNYLGTGEAPRDLKDYYFPRTGGTTPDGADERVNLPSYVKDVVEYNEAPGQTALNKLHPEIAMLPQMYNNRDFYGALIADPEDPGSQQLVDWLKYFGGQVEPFSVRSFQRLEGEKDSKLSPWAALFGINPAPGYITNPNRGEAFQARMDRIARRRKMREAERP